MSKDAINFTKIGIKYPRNNQIGGDLKGFLGILKSRQVTVDRCSPEQKKGKLQRQASLDYLIDWNG